MTFLSGWLSDGQDLNDQDCDNQNLDFQDCDDQDLDFQDFREGALETFLSKCHSFSKGYAVS